jgi:putative FmdB family regulatory protein
MPTYDYECSNCKSVFDVFVPMSRRDRLMFCKNCKDFLGKRIWKSAPHFKQGGVGVNPDQWTDKFWDSAEKNRVADLEKRNKIAKEMVLDGDKKTVQAIENTIRNTANAGGKQEANAIEKQFVKMSNRGKKK